MDLGQSQLLEHTCGKSGAITGPVTSSSRSSCTSTTTGPPLVKAKQHMSTIFVGRDPRAGLLTLFVSPADAVFIHYFIRQFDIRVAVTEAGYICNLAVSQLKQCVPFFILHLHDVKNTLHSLQWVCRGQGSREHMPQASNTGSKELLILYPTLPSHLKTALERIQTTSGRSQHLDSDGTPSKEPAPPANTCLPQSTCRSGLAVPGFISQHSRS